MEKGIGKIIEPLKEIVGFFKQIGVIFAQFFKMFPKILSLFEMFTDPTKFVKDILWGIVEGTKIIFNALLQQFTGNFNRMPMTRGKSRKESCVDPSLTHIIILVLCPSLALALQIGLRQFHLILVCAVLSYFYYFPGLIYASLFIL